MKPQAISTFPGGSKSRVNKAGSAIAVGDDSPENLKIFEDWRAAHRGVLNTFQAILRTRAKNKNVTVAQRHKRKATILDKLHRHKGMALARMDDVAPFPGVRGNESNGTCTHGRCGRLPIDFYRYRSSK